MLFLDSLIFKSLKSLGVNEKTSLHVIILLKNLAITILLLFAFRAFKDDLVRGAILLTVLLIHSFTISYIKGKALSN